MRHYQYSLSTGQTIVSPVDLSYAYDPSSNIDLNAITPSDFRKISILADEKMADIVTELSDGKQWRTPSSVLSQPVLSGISSAKNFCVIHNGTIYIKDGRKYIKLESFLKNASHDELEFVLRYIAFQASVCQAALAGEEASREATNEAV